MRLFQGQKQPVEALAFSADSRYLAATDGAGVSVYEIPSGSRVQRLPSSRGRPHLLTFLPNGRLVVVASTFMWVQIKPTVSGGGVGFYPDEVAERPHSLFASPDGTRLLAVTPNTLHCWTMTGHVPQGAWTVEVGKTYPTIGAAISADGEQVVICQTLHGLKWYSARTGDKETGWNAKPVVVPRLAWSPDGRLIPVSSDSDLYWLDRESNQRPARSRTGSGHHFSALVFHPSGRWLLVGCGDGTVRLYDPALAAEVRSFAWPVGKVRSVAVSPDGMLAAAGGDKGQVVVWDVDE